MFPQTLKPLGFYRGLPYRKTGVAKNTPQNRLPAEALGDGRS